MPIDRSIWWNNLFALDRSIAVFTIVSFKQHMEYFNFCCRTQLDRLVQRWAKGNLPCSKSDMRIFPWLKERQCVGRHPSKGDCYLPPKRRSPTGRQISTSEYLPPTGRSPIGRQIGILEYLSPKTAIALWAPWATNWCIRVLKPVLLASPFRQMPFAGNLFVFIRQENGNGSTFSWHVPARDVSL